MSRRTRKARQLALKNSTALASTAQAWTGFGGSIFDGANASTRRGYIYVPTADTRREITTWSRMELLRRARFMVRNVGFAKRCIWGLARMCGWLSPRPLTNDKEWNALAMRRFEQLYGSSPLVFDLQGRQNFYSYQPLAIATRLQDGDFFTAFTQDADGHAQVMSYEAHQLSSNALVQPDPRGNLCDGIRTDPWGRMLSVELLKPEANFFDPQSQDVIPVPASAIVQHADFLSTGHVRGVTALHHAITHLMDRTEIIADLKTGIKIANRIAFYISNQAPQSRAAGPTGMTVSSTATTDKNPTLRTPAQWTMEDLYNYDRPGGKTAELDPGQRIEQLLDQRPHPNNIEFLEHLNRDIAAGLDMAPEVLWNIAKLGGASVRYVMADAQKTIERMQQLLVDQFLTRFWVFFISCEVAAGRLRPCEDPAWYMVGWQPQAKLTVDVGREGRLSIDLHRAGMLTLSQWYSAQGIAWEAEVEQQVEEYAHRVKTCAEASARYGFDITPEKVWPDLMPTQTPAPAEVEQPFDAEEPNASTLALPA